MPTPFEPPSASLKPEIAFVESTGIDSDPTVGIALLHLLVSVAIIFVGYLATAILMMVFAYSRNDNPIIDAILTILAEYAPLCITNIYLACWLPRKICYVIGLFWSIIIALMTIAPFVLFSFFNSVGRDIPWTTWCTLIGLFPITWATIEFTRKYRLRLLKNSLSPTNDQK